MVREAVMTLDIFAFGAVIAVFAGVSAYLIVLHEMGRHFATSAEPRREALHSALAAALFFVVLGGVLALALPWMLSGV
jgi:hypothetical protein